LHPNQEKGLEITMRSKQKALKINKLALSILVLFASFLSFSNVPEVRTETQDSNQRTVSAVEVTPTHEVSAPAHEEKHAEGEHKNTEIEGPVDTQEEIGAYIQHHLQDSHDFHLYTDGKSGTHYGFPLLTMFFDNGFHAFSSSKWEHGHAVVEDNGNFYKLHHSKIYRTDAQGTLNLHEGHPTNPKAFDISITKNVFGLLLAATLIFLGFGSLAKGYKKSPIPTGTGRFLEPLVLFVRDEIAIPNIGEKKYRKFMGYLLTVFFLIWTLNLLGMTPFGFGVTNNIAVTSCFALFTYLIIQFSANKDYWKHIFWMPGVPVPMKIAFIPIELLGTITKPFSLMIRLFANMTAGHVVVMTLISLAMTFKAQFGVVGSTGMSFFFTLFISLIELLVAFLQAFIFTMLSSLFIGLATAEHEHEHSHSH
jgi:F-type H+-transporting ATPase subunit a